MLTTVRSLGCAMLLTAGSAGAVELSPDAQGQLLFLPYVEAGDNSHTDLYLRNTSATDGKAVRIVARDPLAGRPTATLNVYLGPLDAWRGRVEQASAGVARILATDGSCARPFEQRLLDQGLVFSDVRFDAAEPGDRLASASVEIYEMGTIPAELAIDCAAIAARWTVDGLWRVDPGADVSAPTGTLEASATIVESAPAAAFHYRAFALDGFRDAPLHTAPSALSPHLGDVSPPVSTTFETIQLPDFRLKLEQVLDWTSYPVNAVNAVLMTTTARGEFISNRNDLDLRPGSGDASAVLAYPTRAFHTDASGFYLRPGDAVEPGPFAASPELDVGVADLDGNEYTLAPPVGLTNCNLARASTTVVSLADTNFFSGECDAQSAIFFVSGPPNVGEVSFRFEGQIVSDGGRIVRGQPVIPILFQSLEGVRDAPGRRESPGWADYLEVDQAAF